MDVSIHPYANEIELSEIQREFRTTVNDNDPYYGNRIRKEQYLPVIGSKSGKRLLSKQLRQFLWIAMGIVLIGIVVGIVVVVKSRSIPSESVVFGSCDELESFPANIVGLVKQLRFESGFDCNGIISLNRFTNCEKIEIADAAMTRVSRIDIIGLTRLREIVVGDGSCLSLSELNVMNTLFDQLSSIQIGSNSLNELTSIRVLNAASLRSLSIGSSSLRKLDQFRMSLFSSLQSVRIGSHSLTSVRELELDGLQHLEKLEVDDGAFEEVEKLTLKDVNPIVLSGLGMNGCASSLCFTLNKNTRLNRLKVVEVGEDCLNDVNGMEINGCDELESVIIGANSLNGTTDATSRFVIQNCPRLASIMMGDDTFVNYASFAIRNCTQLSSLGMGRATFQSVQTAEMVELPLLNNITLGLHAMSGCSSDDRKGIKEEPYNFKNTVIMRNLPSLASFKGDGFNFKHFGTVILESHVNKLKTNGIQLGSDSFFYSYSIQPLNANALSTWIREANWVFFLDVSDYISPYAEEWIVPDMSYGYSEITTLKFTGLHNLKRIEIGNECFKGVRQFTLIRLNELESLEIKSGSFYLGLDEKSDGVCRIAHCPKLKSIQIRKLSFYDYHAFELDNLPSLLSIELAYNVFTYVPSFSLTDLPSLQSVSLGSAVFGRIHSVVFENLPLLQVIQLDWGVFQGDGRDNRKMSDNEPYFFNNTLTMRNLPMLTSFKGSYCNFMNVGSVTLDNIPNLDSNGIDFNTPDVGSQFKYTYSILSSSMICVMS